MTDRAEDYDDFMEDDRPHWRRRLIVLATLVIVAVVGAFALWFMVFRDGGTTAAQTQTAKVTRGNIAQTISTSATTLAQSTANLSFSASGKVTAVNVKLGQAVKQGDVLAAIEPDTLQNAVSNAQVNLANAQAKLNTLLQGSTASELTSADQSVVQGQANLDKANTALQDLYNPTSDALNSAQQAVLSAQSQLTKAQQARTAVDTNWSDAVSAAQTALDKAKTAANDAFDALDLAQTNLEAAENVYDACGGKAYSGSLGTPISSSAQGALSAEASEGTALCSSEASKVLSANSAYKSAETAKSSADDAVDTARDSLDKLGSGPDSNDVSVADANVQSAQLALQSANDKLAALSNPSADDVSQAQQAVDSAQAALSAAQAKRDEVYAGSTSADIQAQQSQVQLAQLSLTQANKALEGAQIIAPFDGTVAALNINVGDTAGSSSSSSSSTSAAIVLNTPNAVVLNLSIGESDLPNVKAGQSGTASFDAITGTVFPIVIDSVGTNPTTTQGVETYQARAHIVAGQSAGAATGRSRIPSAGRTPQAQQTPNATPNAAPTAAPTATAVAQPVPGMNATVTIVTAQSQNVLIVPTAAIQRSGTTSVVTIQNDDGSTTRQVVETGLSEGTNTEITNGLQEGQTVIIPGATTTASQSSQTANATTVPLFGGSSGGGGIPGGGGFPGRD